MPYPMKKKESKMNAKKYQLVRVARDIENTLEDCKEDIPDYELSNEGGDFINQGWIEALEYVLNVIEIHKDKHEATTKEDR